MVLVIVLAALSLWSLVALVVDIRRDGHRPVATDWSRVPAADR